MATAQFGRVITAMITPFTEDGAVDYESAVALAKHLVAHGSEGLLVGGTTGEGVIKMVDGFRVSPGDVLSLDCE